MKIEINKSLKEFNAFKLNIMASEFVEINNLDDFYDLVKYIKSYSKKRIIIGDATNILFLDDFDGLVIKNLIEGIEVLNLEGDTSHGRGATLRGCPDKLTGSHGELPVQLKVFSGVVWDDFVAFAVDNGFGGGIENLVKIPGRVGSAIVQNIGAYGVEIKDLLVSVEAYSFEDNKIVCFKKSELEFEYRNSFFKKNSNKYFIISAIFQLKNKPKSFILDYGNIKANIGKDIELSPLVIANVIRKIRESKLPDYKVLGNCGSFFKNPVIDFNLFNLLKSKYKEKEIPNYKVDENLIKIPAAWLIETAGFKGFRLGGARVYEKHSLIIVNYDNASPQDIKSLSDMIINKVFEDFGIKLEPEVIFI